MQVANLEERREHIILGSKDFCINEKNTYVPQFLWRRERSKFPWKQYLKKKIKQLFTSFVQDKNRLEKEEKEDNTIASYIKKVSIIIMTIICQNQKPNKLK